MTDVVENKIVSILDALQNGAMEIGGQMVKYAPDVAATALMVTRIDGIQWMVVTVVALILGFGLIWLAIKIEDHDATGPVVGFGLGVSIFGLFNFLNIWNWIAIFEPKLYIAHQIINTTLGK